MSVTFQLILSALAELLYALTTRAWMPFHFKGIELELLISAGRALVAAIVWRLFRDFLAARSGAVRRSQRPLVLAATAALCLAAVLVGRAGLSGWPLRCTFAATSLVVGLHEELVYRGVLQNLLRSRLNLLPALLLCNLVFTLYHYGAQPLNPLNFTSIFLTGCTLGLIYERTGSLRTVIAIHTIVDAIYSFTPLLQTPWPPLFGDFIVFFALLMALSLYPSAAARARSKMPQFVRIADDI